MSLQLPNYLYYTNEFAQAKLKEEVYIESPWGFSQKDGKNELKLNTSLYALKQAPKTFYKKLQGGFLERGLNKLNLNTWLFMKNFQALNSFKIGEFEVQVNKTVKNLGVILDSNLSLKEQIKMIRK